MWLLFISYSIYVYAQYAVASAAVSTVIFYALVVPATGFAAYEQRASIHAILKNRMVTCFLVLFAFIIFHALFLTQGYEGSSKTIRNCIANSAFFFSSLVFFSRVDRTSLKRFFTLLSYVAGMCALYSLYRYFFAGMRDFDVRLIPIGRAQHQILGAHVFGVGGLVALYMCKQERDTYRKLLHAAVFAIIGYLILLTGSRMPIFAYFLSAALGGLFYIRFSKTHLLYLIASVALAGVMVLSSSEIMAHLYQFKQDMMARGDSFRLELWQQAITKTLSHPFFGNGMRAQLEAPINAPLVHTPHNIFLGTAYYIGIPAALLFCGLVLTSSFRVVADTFKREPFAILIAMTLLQGVLSGMTDHAQLVKSPGPLWLIFWLPITMAIAYPLRAKNLRED